MVSLKNGNGASHKKSPAKRKTKGPKRDQKLSVRFPRKGKRVGSVQNQEDAIPPTIHTTSGAEAKTRQTQQKPYL